MVNSRHGITDSKKGPYKFNPLRWSSIEIESNSLMYNPNKEIRDRVFPVKIGKFSVKYYTFEELQR